jgi:hypothetical protein
MPARSVLVKTTRPAVAAAAKGPDAATPVYAIEPRREALGRDEIRPYFVN